MTVRRSDLILPGATIGVLGSGQLGRMFALAARRLGYRVHIFGPGHDTPAGQVADLEVEAPYDDLDKVVEFARRVDVVTFEFENVPVAAAAAAAEHTVVRPDGRALEVAQHRIREKTFLASRGFPVPAFAQVTSEDDAVRAARQIPPPAVLKTAALGYDGKGQVPISQGDDVLSAWRALGSREAILETFVELDCEMSVIAARGVNGASSHFAPFENVHRHHILDVSVAPADVREDVQAEAVRMTHEIMNALDYVGVLCIEFFVARDGRLFINELAPRTHNSGHLTMDACRTNQFEQQVRAICGLPLGSPDLLQPAAMVNLLGDLWQPGEPDWAAALSFPDVKLHLYGKSEPRPGRKMGHLTALAPTRHEARARAMQARAALHAPSTHAPST